MSNFICVECGETAPKIVSTAAGAMLCEACLKAYYVACADCAQVIPLDEARTRAALVRCVACDVKPPGVAGAGALDQSGLESLIAEYATLHAEEKRIGARLEEIKERLKNVAATQPRVSGAVTLRAGEAAVKCSFRTTLKCDAAVVEQLAQTLDKNNFDELFERKVTYSPHQERVQEFLHTTDSAREEARELLRAAVRAIESATLTVVPISRK